MVLNGNNLCSTYAGPKNVSFNSNLPLQISCLEYIIWCSFYLFIYFCLFYLFLLNVGDAQGAFLSFTAYIGLKNGVN